MDCPLCGKHRLRMCRFVLKPSGKVEAKANCPKCGPIANEVPFTPETEFIFAQLKKHENEAGAAMEISMAAEENVN